jgi:hypothetical protein
MLKAGALYFAIVITFFIAIISASLIMLASHYRSTYLKEMRLTRLLNNLNAGVIYSLANENRAYGSKTIDLYTDQTDSLQVERKQWGLFDLVVLKAFIKQDTLKKVFLVGTETDSTVLYLSDEDRPLAISGNTKITGNAVLPKSGIRQAYVDSKPYNGSQLVYDGKISNSERYLKSVDAEMLKQLVQNLKNKKNRIKFLGNKDLKFSFLDTVQNFNLPQKAVLANISLSGNMVLFADSSVTISATCTLNNIQIYAPYIKVEDGFKGNCQLFASDSISIGNRVIFNYPSVAGIIKNENLEYQPLLKLGTQAQFNGVLFTYEAKRSVVQTSINLGKDAKVTGEIYSSGFLQLERGTVITGKISCNRFVMKSPTTRYENFLIDAVFNRKTRSQYYLSTRFFEGNHENKVLKWLN